VYSSNVNSHEINESILKAKEKLSKKSLTNSNLKSVQEAQRQYYQNKQRKQSQGAPNSSNL